MTKRREAAVPADLDEPPKVVGVNRKNGCLAIEVGHADPAAYQEAYSERVAGKVISFAQRIANESGVTPLKDVERNLLTAAELPEEVGAAIARYHIVALADTLPDKVTTEHIIKSIAPRDGVEALLATQMAAVHVASIKAARRLENCEWADQLKMQEGALNRLTRTFASQVEALRKHRTGGEQTVRHVHVNDGGQAIVADTINSTRIQGEGGDG